MTTPLLQYFSHHLTTISWQGSDPSSLLRTVFSIHHVESSGVLLGLGKHLLTFCGCSFILYKGPANRQSARVPKLELAKFSARCYSPSQSAQLTETPFFSPSPSSFLSNCQEGPLDATASADWSGLTMTSAHSLLFTRQNRWTQHQRAASSTVKAERSYKQAASLCPPSSPSHTHLLCGPGAIQSSSYKQINESSYIILN